MEATEDGKRTVADVAKVKVEVQENEKLSWVLETVRTLHEEGVKDIQAILHLSESQAPMERFESVEIGDSKWRQNLQIPCSMSLNDRNKYIEDRAVGAAQAFAKAAAAAKGA